MKNTSAQVDAYIAAAAPFAQPILRKLRQLYHQACPEIEETLKWGAPTFMHRGIVGGMAAFKKHAYFGFWKAKLMRDPHGLFRRRSRSSFNADQLTDVSELPSDAILLAYIRQAVKLNADGVPLPRTKARASRPVKVPPDFRKVLAAHPKAKAVFDAFSPSCRREYVEWITEAKREETRQRRIANALEWLAEGKERNWKYQ